MNVAPESLAVARGWPEPDAHARALSQKLTGRLRDEIHTAGGFIPFRRYMEAVLYEPGLGYYSAGSRKLGADGDFVTAPEVSPIFAACLVRHCAQVLDSIGGGVLLEVGAGSGALAGRLLQHLQNTAKPPDAYLILETSAELRQRQQTRIRSEIPDLAERVRWLDVPPAEPWRGLLIANEVLDALPVERICLDGGRIWQQGVGVRDDGFQWLQRAAPAELNAQIRALLATLPVPLPEPYRTEFNPRLGPWLEAVAGNLQHGVALFVDYGYAYREYYHPDRSDGTLICHYRHRAHGDPFLFPGLQDVSASVDFSAVADWGLLAGMDVCGYTTLAHFLIDCGLDQVMHELSGTEVSPTPEVARQARLLTLPGEMGERFKAIALGRNVPGPLRGFAQVDHRPRLFPAA